MLHIGADDLGEFLQRARERGLLPAARVASDAEAVGGGVPCGEPQAVVVNGRGDLRGWGTRTLTTLVLLHTLSRERSKAGAPEAQRPR